MLVSSSRFPSLPCIGAAQAQSVLAVTIHRRAFLQKLSARLNELEYVDYAQPNATVRFTN